MAATKVQEHGARSLEEGLARKDQLEARFVELAASCAVAQTDARDRHQKAQEASRKADEFLKEARQHGIRTQDDLAAESREHLNALRSHAADLEAAADQAGQKWEAIDRERKEIRAELDRWSMKVSARAVTVFQTELEAARDAVAFHQAKIAEQENIVRRHSTSPPGVEELEERREDLLADIAVGDATEADLVEIETEIEARNKARSQHKAHAGPITEQARKTIAGLQRKLTQAQAEVTRLEAMRPKVMLQFFQTEAETLGRKYAKLAHDLAHCLGQIVALDGFARPYADNPGRPLFLTHNWETMLIPTLQLEACRRGIGTGNPMALFRGSRYVLDTRALEAAKADERSRLEAMGIDPL